MEMDYFYNHNNIINVMDNNCWPQQDLESSSMEFEEEIHVVKTDGAHRKSRSRAPQFLATTLVDTLAISFGMAMGWSSTALPLLQSDDSPLTSGPISSSDASWLASILCLVAIPSTPLYRYICEQFGRKVCGYLTVIPGIISILLLISAQSVVMLYASRIIIGFTLAGTFIFCPVYVSEIAEDSIRGTLGVIIMLFRDIGICFSYIIGSYCSFRVVAWISLVPLVVLLLGLFWLPESPVYLLKQHKQHDATRALHRLRGKGSDVSEELDNMKTALRAMGCETASAASYRELFSTKVTIRALIIILILRFNQQLCGFYGILSHSVVIFQASGSAWSPNVSSIIVGFMLMGGTILSTILCDRVGRKPLLVASNTLMAICLVLLSIYFYFSSHGKDVSSLGWLPVTCLSVYVVALNVGLASLPCLIETELCSPNFRSAAISITSPIAWSLTFLVSKYFTGLSDWIGIYGSYWVFASVCIIGMVLIITTLPETKNRPVESILEELETTGFFSKAYSNRKYAYLQGSSPVFVCSGVYVGTALL